MVLLQNAAAMAGRHGTPWACVCGRAEALYPPSHCVNSVVGGSSAPPATVGMPALKAGGGERASETELCR